MCLPKTDGLAERISAAKACLRTMVNGATINEVCAFISGWPDVGSITVELTEAALMELRKRGQATCATNGRWYYVGR